MGRRRVFDAFWREGLLAYDALQGIDWAWLALDGEAFPDRYLASVWVAGTPSYTMVSFRTSADANVVTLQRSASLLWGSVDGSNQLVLGGPGAAAKIQGADILAAAGDLGIADSGSFYVTVNALTGGFYSIDGRGDAAAKTATTMEWAPLQVSAPNVEPNVTLPPNGSGVGAGDAADPAPAPVVGATPAGGLLGLGLLGMLGLRRRARAAATWRGAGARHGGARLAR